MRSPSLRWTAYSAALGLGLGLLASCSRPLPLESDVACTLNIAPGLVVSILDAQSGTPLAAGATVLARSGSYSDNLRPAVFQRAGDSLVMVSRQGADERAGTYRIEITHPGYAPRVLDGIRVDRNVCHVITREVELQLIPLP